MGWRFSGRLMVVQPLQRDENFQSAIDRFDAGTCSRPQEFDS